MTLIQLIQLHWKKWETKCTLQLLAVCSVPCVSCVFFLSNRSKLFHLPPGRQSGKCIQISKPWQHIVAGLCVLVVWMITLFCELFSITTWWWLLQRLHLPQLQKITTCYSTVSFPTAPLRCYGSSRGRPGAVHWQPPMEAAIVAAPVVWCPPAACGTATKTGSETETGTATPSQDCQDPRWRLRRRRPFMAPYLTLSLLTRSTLNWKTRELKNGSSL